jgi:hypothetical protein
MKTGAAATIRIIKITITTNNSVSENPPFLPPHRPSQGDRNLGFKAVVVMESRGCQQD